MITEPDVALTDYGLAVECAVFTYLIYRNGTPGNRLRIWFVVFFGSIALASLAGGTVHGFFLDEKTVGSAILWPSTLIAIGVTALAAWAIGARLLFSSHAARWISAAAAAEFCAYSFVVLALTQEFWIAVAMYLPAAIFLFIALCFIYRRGRDLEILIGLLGLALTLVASFVQQAGISLHLLYFNHNALYHLIEAAALYMMFRLSRVVATTPKL